MIHSASNILWLVPSSIKPTAMSHLESYLPMQTTVGFGARLYLVGTIIASKHIITAAGLSFNATHYFDQSSTDRLANVR